MKLSYSPIFGQKAVLVNLMGVTVLRQQFTGRARLPEGLYLLRLHSGNSYSTYKVMKK